MPITGSSAVSAFRSSPRRATRLATVLAAAALLGLGPGVGSAPAAGYVIGARDVLKINVYGQNDMSRHYDVSDDGTITFPLIGSLRCAGLTEAQVAEALTTLLSKDYLVNPQVSVTVAEYRSQKVLVLGDVARPGPYALSGRTTLLDIVTQAGAFAGSATKQVIVIRPKRTPARPWEDGGNQRQTWRFRVDGFQAAGESGEFELEDGDTVVASRLQSVLVLGEVGRPGALGLEKEDTSLLEVIAAAGGFTPKASRKGVQVIRMLPNAKEETQVVDLSGAVPAARNFRVQEGDTVVVPRGNAFFVMGAVRNPGTYPLESGLTILEAISIAGGFTDRAAPGRTKIIRTTKKGQETIYVDMNDIIKRGQRDRAVPLHEDDIIVVPESFF
jgi:polysaccharide export outer membrane protein